MAQFFIQLDEYGERAFDDLSFLHNRYLHFVRGKAHRCQRDRLYDPFQHLSWHRSIPERTNGAAAGQEVKESLKAMHAQYGTAHKGDFMGWGTMREEELK